MLQVSHDGFYLVLHAFQGVPSKEVPVLKDPAFWVPSCLTLPHLFGLPPARLSSPVGILSCEIMA